MAVRHLVPPLLGLFMPFVLALVAAWLLDPLVRLLQRKLGLARGLLSLALILLAFGAVSGVLFGLGWALFGEVEEPASAPETAGQ